DRPGPRALVDGSVEADLGQVERRPLQRQRYIDRGATLIDGEADIDARCHARADARDAADGAALVAEIVGLRTGGHSEAIELAPGPVARAFGRFRGAAAGRIGAHAAPEPVGGLVVQPLQEIAAEIG